MITAERMRVRLGLAADDAGMDAVIDQLITEAEAYARSYCRLRAGEAIPEFLLIQMTAEDYGRLGGAGLEARSLSGASENYRAQYSDGVTAVLRSLRHPGGTAC